ncbi:radical SAM protein [Enterococcus sp. LJL99]
MIIIKSIVLNIDSKCNASCKHCCFSCSSKSSEHLSDEELDNLVEYILNNDEIEVVSLTGGEALLRKDKVLEIIKLISNVGKKVTLISNGYWAVTPQKTEMLLQDLYDRGLRALTISYDDYHREYIPLIRIQNILNVIKKI